MVDLLQMPGEEAPQASSRVLCRHPFQESKRAYVKPARVEPLYKCYWKDGEVCIDCSFLLSSATVPGATKFGMIIYLDDLVEVIG